MIELNNVCVNYKNKNFLTDFNLKIKEGSVTAILGENGSGKTTLAKVIAGLLDFSGKISGVPEKISFLFQEDRLIPNLTVKENIKLVSKGVDVDKILKEYNFTDGDKYIKEFSGGKKRKVAIIRAISHPADLLILDEPFSSIDIKSKSFFIEKIKKLHRETKNTILYITHNIDEALAFSNRIIVTANGKVVKDVKKITENTKSELFSVMMN